MEKLSRRSFLRLASAGAGVALLSACGTRTTPAPQEPGGEPVVVEPGVEKVTVEMWTPHPLEDNIGITEFLAENYLPDNPDTDFLFTRVPSEWEQKFATSAAGGTLPDIFAVDGINLPTFANRGLCAEIPETLISKEVLDDFFPSALVEMQFRGRTYATTIETNSQALRINVDKMNEAGVDPPETWDEMITVGQQLTVDANGNHPNDAGFNWDAVQQWAFETWCCLGEGSTWMVLPWIWMNGGDVYNASTREVLIDKPEAVRGIQFLRDLVHEYKIWPRAGVAQAGPEGTFYGQVVIMSATGAFNLAALTVQNPPPFSWDILKFPRPADGEYISGVGGWLFSGNRTTPRLEQTLRILAYTTTEEWQLHTSTLGYALTGRKSVAEKRLQEVPQLAIFLEAMATGRARPRSTQYPLITDALQQAFDEAIFGDRTPEAALADAAPKIEDALAQEDAE
jgi:multiple sugar transport system substrate-binding protein